MANKKEQPDFLVVSAVLLCVGTTVAMVQYEVPSILEPVMESYSMNTSQGAALMSVFTAIGIFLSLPTGSLVKKIGPKKVLLLACSIIIFGSVIGSLSSSAWPLIISRGIEGIAFVLVSVAGPLAVQKYVDDEHQGTANGIWSLWICLGSVIGSTATPLIMNVIGIAGTWLLYAAIVLVAGTALLFLVKDQQMDVSTESVEETDMLSFADHLSLLKPNALLYFFAYLVFNIEILAVLSYTPTFLQNQGMNASLSGFASSLPGLLAIASALIFGKLIDSTGMTKPFYVISLIAAAPSTFLMLTQSGPLLWVGAALMGLIGYGIPVACLTSLPQIAGKTELVPAAMGILMLIQCLGEFLGSWLTPLLLGPQMDNWVLCGAVMFAMGAAAALAMLLCKIK